MSTLDPSSGTKVALTSRRLYSNDASVAQTKQLVFTSSVYKDYKTLIQWSRRFTCTVTSGSR